MSNTEIPVFLPLIPLKNDGSSENSWNLIGEFQNFRLYFKNNHFHFRGYCGNQDCSISKPMSFSFKEQSKHVRPRLKSELISSPKTTTKYNDAE